MDQVEFEPAQHWSATVLKAEDHCVEHNLLTRCGKMFNEQFQTIGTLSFHFVFNLEMGILIQLIIGIHLHFLSSKF